MSMCAVLILKCQNVELNKLHVCGIVEYKSTIICYDGLTVWRVTMSNAHRKQ